MAAARIVPTINVTRIRSVVDKKKTVRSLIISCVCSESELCENTCIELSSRHETETNLFN